MLTTERRAGLRAGGWGPRPGGRAAAIRGYAEVRLALRPGRGPTLGGCGATGERPAPWVRLRHARRGTATGTADLLGRRRR